MSVRIRKIAKLLEAARHRHDLYTVFSDCMEAMAITLANAADTRQRDDREARYLKIVGRYDRSTIETWPQILAELALALEESPTDVLGAVFGMLELHNAYRGQFFTPFEVCCPAARMQIGDGAGARRIIEQSGFITVHEPACGAGAMVIAFAETLREAGINYQQHMHVTAVDVDPRAAHIAYVQFSLLHIPATVIVGNSLTLETRESWFTPAHILGGWSRRLAVREPRALDAEPPKAPVVPATTAVNPAPAAQPVLQLSLF
ncbi:SAM-dependent DNA methyltransferase [Gluconacetobacter sp. 1c LMG 22058]|uniref:SAM-dependent DNA methyltransferase n=1 Tax=Gluconacetobacter dulcium TaxID=2729096 RepID=A0A7W4K3W0_9PROT|nr:class I SAM-dependent methyltransferase [Gluconacetobacter dulcium]MBB2199896.1 SAM-dependent DNA methyltransferase [Gluconacetobacter dulcium]